MGSVKNQIALFILTLIAFFEVGLNIDFLWQIFPPQMDSDYFKNVGVIVSKTPWWDPWVTAALLIIVGFILVRYIFREMDFKRKIVILTLGGMSYIIASRIIYELSLDLGLEAEAFVIASLFFYQVVPLIVGAMIGNKINKRQSTSNSA